MGVYYFEKTEIDTNPGSKISMKLVIEGLNTFGNDISFLDTSPQISIEVRKCMNGE